MQSEELRASNEELQVINEELRSSAEELETSKEELQSINEELTTVNQELKVKIEELSHTNNNFQNLINSIDIGVVFLDRSLRVNLFSPAAQKIFNLLSNDIGRPLSDITSKLDYSDLYADADRVIETLRSVKREVTTAEGQVFVMGIFPYRTAEDRINGVVVTFVDITERKRAEEAVSQSENRLRGAIEIETVGVLFSDAEGRYNGCNAAFTKMSGWGPEDMSTGKKKWNDLTPKAWLESSQTAMQELKETGRIEPYEKEYVRKDGSRFWGLVAASQLNEGAFVEYVIDITEKKKAEAAFSRANEELEDKVKARTRELADVVVERTDAERQVKDLLRQLVSVQEEERRRIAHEIHDQLGQEMTALRLKLENIAIKDENGLKSQIDSVREIAEEIDSTIGYLAWEMRPPALDELGLESALNDFIREWSKHSGITAEFAASGVEGVRFPVETGTNLYRILQEALQNVQKHAHATQVSALLELRDGQVALIVEDNGRGYDQKKVERARKSHCMGIINMRERAALIGGTLDVETSEGNGTTVFVRLPIPDGAAGKCTHPNLTETRRSRILEKKVRFYGPSLI